jgi:chloramphenicol O-acetyltransferase type B
MTQVSVSLSSFRKRGIEVLSRGAPTIKLPQHTVLEIPTSLKWTQYEHSLEMGAFSYQVSGYCFAGRIGRYCSMGENVQIGRQNHPMDWVSTSPALYLGNRIFDLDDGFEAAEQYHSSRLSHTRPPTKVKVTTIGNDVWIGHGAYIAAGVTVGDGAVVGAQSVVTRDVAPYTVVAGNPATIRRMRLPPSLISLLLKCRWWQFAPWQIDHLDPSNVLEFSKGIHTMLCQVKPHTPEIVDLRAGSAQ